MTDYVKYFLYIIINLSIKKNTLPHHLTQFFVYQYYKVDGAEMISFD